MNQEFVKSVSPKTKKGITFWLKKRGKFNLLAKKKGPGTVEIPQIGRHGVTDTTVFRLGVIIW
jgi:hypothetical protein